MVVFTEQANAVFLFDRPVIRRDHQAVGQVQDHADRCVLRFLRYQELATARPALHERRAVCVEGAHRYIVLKCDVLAHIVDPGVLANHECLVDRDEVRRPEGLGPGATQHELVDGPPAEGKLADRCVTDVGEVLVTQRELHVE